MQLNQQIQKRRTLILKTKSETNLAFKWIKTHTGHEGNELTDKLAKETSHRPLQK